MDWTGRRYLFRGLVLEHTDHQWSPHRDGLQQSRDRPVPMEMIMFRDGFERVEVDSNLFDGTSPFPVPPHGV